MTFEENWEEEEDFFHLWPPSLHKKFMADIPWRDL